MPDYLHFGHRFSNLSRKSCSAVFPPTMLDVACSSEWRVILFWLQIRERCKDLILSDETIAELMRRILKDVEKGLNKDTHKEAVVKCFITYVQDLPNGTGELSFIHPARMLVNLEFLFYPHWMQYISLGTNPFNIYLKIAVPHLFFLWLQNGENSWLSILVEPIFEYS